MPQTATRFQIIIEDNTHVCHHRYGHLGFKGLRTLQRKQMMRELPN